MEYKIVKPEVTNIRIAAWRAMKQQWQFWVVMGGGILFSGGLLYFVAPGLSATKSTGGEFWQIFMHIGLLPVYVFLVYFAFVYIKIHATFWKDIATLNHWTYTPKILDIPTEGVIFQRGRRRTIGHHISGIINNDRKFELFQYSFVTGSGKESRTHSFFVITFTFDGNFPHIYLNSKRDWYDVADGETLSLPQEFEKKFSLHAPRKYEIEALAIFTPDVLAKILDIGIVNDIEFVGQKMIICIEGFIDDVDKLEKELETALKIEDLLDEKLDAFKFHKIGDMPYYLKK